MQRQSTQLRKLLRQKTFLHMPSVYDALGGRLVQSLGYEATYIGGYVTGGSMAVTEPLLTMTEQVRLAADIAQSISIPLLADAGAGFGEALHTMRTVREFIHKGIAGVHIEDQLYPKRAHYHKYVVHGIPVEEFVEKIEFSVKQREESDPDFVIIARTDTCRALGLEEAQSLGNRDGRPLFSRQELEQMGYVGCIEAQVVLCSAFHFLKKVLTELRQTGSYSGMTNAEWVASRQQVEDLIDLSKYYEIEAQTVEARQEKDKPSGKH